MPIYSYTALKHGKEIVKGEVTASNLKDARDVVRKMGYIPTKIEEYVDKSKNKFKRQLSHISLADKIDFTSTLQILLSSGISAVESLTFMEKEASRDKIRLLAGSLKSQILAGSALADAMAKYADAFGNIAVGLMKAGEEAGELEKTLGRIKDILTKQANLKAKVIGTLMYPAFVICLAFVITIIMLVFVFPAFKGMFDQQGAELPFITAVMIKMGDFLKHYWYVIPIFIVSFVAFCYFSYTWRPAREIVDRYVLKIPLINNLIMYANYSNFMSVLSVTYDAGIPIIDCLHLSVTTLSNVVLTQKLSSAVKNVQQGSQLSVAFRATKVMPKMLLFMVQTGEQSGRLGDMLEKAVNFLDKTLDGIIDTMTKMIEPIMLLVIGSIVLVMALALYLPLFQSYML